MAKFTIGLGQCCIDFLCELRHRNEIFSIYQD